MKQFLSILQVGSIRAKTLNSFSNITMSKIQKTIRTI